MGRRLGRGLAEIWVRSQGEEEGNNGTPREVDGRAVNCRGDTDTLQEATIHHGAAGLVTSICTPSDIQRKSVRK